MAHQLSATLCSKCRSPLEFKPRINVNSANLDVSSDSALDPDKIPEMILLSNKDLDDYDAEINRLRSQISYVEKQKQLVNDYKTQLQSLISFFRQFPNEILCAIFELACTNNLFQEYPWPSNQESGKPTTTLSSPAITYLPALSISAVCTRWRSLALTLPRLWSQLRLEISGYSVPVRADIHDRFMSILKLYLDRSADIPLSIDLETTDGDEGNPSALDQLLEHAYRWQTFNYFGDFNLRLSGLQPEVPSKFPILENLALKGFDFPFTDLSCFEHAPKLRTVGAELLQTDSKLPWAQITCLEVGESNEIMINTLQQCHDLTALKLRSSLRSKWGPNPGDISLARVESFTLFDYANLLENAFYTFTFPSLTKLIIQQGTYKDLWPVESFNTFISRSSCALTTLSLSRVTISDLNLISALRLLPFLTTFSLDGLMDPNYGSPITSHFISSMHSSSPQPLLPKLRSLSIKFLGTLFDDAGLVGMVSSRWIPDRSLGINCLRSLVLCFSDRKVEEVYKPLWDLDRMGMRVVITGID